MSALRRVILLLESAPLAWHSPADSCTRRMVFLMSSPTAAAPSVPVVVAPTQYRVLGAISVAHFLNDLMQSLMISLYPLFRGNFDLSFAQIGLITLCFQLTAAILQPLIGQWIDRRPMPYSLVLGTGFTLMGLLVLAFAPDYSFLLAEANTKPITSSNTDCNPSPTCGNNSVNGATPRMDNQMTRCRPIRSPIGPPNRVPAATANNSKNKCS